MDSRLKTAFDIVNYTATLSNQRRLILEELEQTLVYYVNGGTFKITRELMNFAKNAVDSGHVEDVPFIDDNNLPVVIENVESFLEEITDTYFSAVNDYSIKFNKIIAQRNVKGILEA